MDNRKEIINRLIKNSAEIITEDEFSERLGRQEKLTHYIGFEISGHVHLGTGLMSAFVMKDLTDLGVNCTVWLADWHTIINEKLNNKISTIGKHALGYFTDALKASLLSVGGDPEKIEFRLASDWYFNEKATDGSRYRTARDYWYLVTRIAQHTTISRVLRSVDIMGRTLGQEIDQARTIYPTMQVADIIFQEIDIAHAGMDQRKAHVIMRDVFNKSQNATQTKPIAFHHPLLIGLQKPTTWPIPDDTDERDVIMEMKMSKSKPDSAIFIHDSEEDIERKINKAFCPERETQCNSILNWTGHILFWNRTNPFRIERKKEHGGDIEFTTYEDLAKAYAEGDVHPMDLKTAVTRELIELLEPARKHFAKKDIAAKKSEFDKILKNR